MQKSFGWNRLRTVRVLLRIVAISVLAFGVWRFVTWPPRTVAVPVATEETHKVVRVVDGDTLELESGQRVRLIGVDTPEFGDGKPEPFAREAHEFTRRMVAGKAVRLEFDRERFDKYRRVLAYVYLDDVLLNEAIVHAGLGRVLTRFNYSSRMKKRLLAAQEGAQKRRVGVWRKRP